jgi:hypothetical protein
MPERAKEIIETTFDGLLAALQDASDSDEEVLAVIAALLSNSRIALIDSESACAA